MTAQQIFRGTLIVLMTIAGIYILIVSAHVLVVLLIAIIIASAVRPVVTRLMQWHLPEGPAIVLTYLTLAFLALLLLVLVLPPVVTQLAQYVQNDQQLASQIITAQNWVASQISSVTKTSVTLIPPENIQAAVTNVLTQARSSLPTVLPDLGNTLADIVLIFVMGVYWLTSHEKATLFVTQLTSVTYREQAANMITEAEQTMGGYVRGVALVMTLVGIFNYVPMRIFGVPNATLLAFIIALTTAIPMIGGVIGMVLVVALTLLTAPQYILTVLVISFINQQIESYILSPRIMSSNVGMDPLLVIVYISIGFVLAGVVGGLIAIPVMGTLHILLKYLVIEPHKENITTFKELEDGALLIKTPPGSTTTVSTETPATPTPATPATPAMPAAPVATSSGIEIARR